MRRGDLLRVGFFGTESGLGSRSLLSLGHLSNILTGQIRVSMEEGIIR